MNEKKSLTTEETFALAVQNHKKNNLQVAGNLYNETLKTNPNHVDARNNLGIILLKLGKLQIGYNRAARIIEQMEDNGVVSKANHVGKREVL